MFRILLLLCLFAYIAEGQYKKVPDPPKKKHFPDADKWIQQIHKEGLIGYARDKKVQKASKPVVQEETNVESEKTE
jgi:hypothetical protein